MNADTTQINPLPTSPLAGGGVNPFPASLAGGVISPALPKFLAEGGLFISSAQGWKLRSLPPPRGGAGWGLRLDETDFANQAASSAQAKRAKTMSTRLFNALRNKERRQALRNNTTPSEQKLWQVLRGKQMGVTFRRQHGIAHYIVDFYCYECKLVIELDGDSHYSDAAQEKDSVRDTYLRSIGLRVLRFTNDEVSQHIEGVYAVIERWINPLPAVQSQTSLTRPSPLTGGGVGSAVLASPQPSDKPVSVRREML